jgi:hypothetical protein
MIDVDILSSLCNSYNKIEKPGKALVNKIKWKPLRFISDDYRLEEMVCTFRADHFSF